MRYTLTFLACLGYVQAQSCGAPCGYEEMPCNTGCQPQQQYGGAGKGFGAGSTAQAMAIAKAKPQAQCFLKPAQYGNDGSATLASASKSQQVQAGNQTIVIPDKNTVTDQAKVSESASTGENVAENVEVAKRTFDIVGSISVTEKYNDQSKGQHVASKSGEGASQTRSRTQVETNTNVGGGVGGGCGCGGGCQNSCVCSQ